MTDKHRRIFVVPAGSKLETVLIVVCAVALLIGGQLVGWWNFIGAMQDFLNR